MRAVSLGLIVVAGATQLACSGTDSSSNDDLLNLAVASMAAEGAAQHVEVMHGSGGPLGFGFHADPGRFDCSAGGRDGLTVTRTCVWKDAQGNVQSGYDEQTTATVTMHVEVSGTLDRGHLSGSVHRTSDLTVSGLAGTETSITWNGSGSETSSRVHESDNGTREVAMNSTEAIAAVVIPVPRTETSWPSSGTITRHVSVTFTGGEKDGTTETRDVTVTFDGTQYATVTVNGETFQFDLARRGRPERKGDKGQPHDHP